MAASERRLKFGLIGCGRISTVHLECIEKEPLADLRAVCDIDSKVAASAAEAFNVRAFQDPRQMITEAQLDAVVICSPPNTHRALAESAVQAGANVLCEKPLALTVEDATAMMKAAKDQNKTLMMASKFRYVHDMVHAKNIMDSKMLGEVILFENEFCSRVDMKNRWNATFKVGGGGVLIDNGSHSVDIIRYFGGPIDDLQAIVGKKWQDLEVEDTCRLVARCASGTMASIDLSWSIHKESAYYIHVYGTGGTLEVGWKGSRYKLREKPNWVEFGNGYDKNQAVGAQLRNFIGTVLGKEQPVICPQDAVESVRVIQAAYRSANQNRWEKVSA